MLEEQFNEIKLEYSSIETTQERKNELITLMQDNLKERSGKTSGKISCLDGNDYSLDSDNAEHLYAIDGVLRAEKIKKHMSENSANALGKAQSQNKYDANHPYPNM